MKLTLRALRVNADLRLKEAADLIGVSRYTLRNYELGRRTPNLGTFLRMCRLYNFSDLNLLDYEPKVDGRSKNGTPM